MSENYGETQPLLRDTAIMDAIGYLGPHITCLLDDVGQVQSFVFKTEDIGPWKLSPASVGGES
jgi:hypothetical protein